jgi:hypothetical protein
MFMLFFYHNTQLGIPGTPVRFASQNLGNYPPEREILILILSSFDVASENENERI